MWRECYVGDGPILWRTSIRAAGCRRSKLLQSEKCTHDEPRLSATRDSPSGEKARSCRSGLSVTICPDTRDFSSDLLVASHARVEPTSPPVSRLRLQPPFVPRPFSSASVLSASFERPLTGSLPCRTRVLVGTPIDRELSRAAWNQSHPDPAPAYTTNRPSTSTRAPRGPANDQDRSRNDGCRRPRALSSAYARQPLEPGGSAPRSRGAHASLRGPPTPTRGHASCATVNPGAPPLSTNQIHPLERSGVRPRHAIDRNGRARRGDVTHPPVAVRAGGRCLFRALVPVGWSVVGTVGAVGGGVAIAVEVRRRSGPGSRVRRRSARSSSTSLRL